MHNKSPARKHLDQGNNNKSCLSKLRGRLFEIVTLKGQCQQKCVRVRPQAFRLGLNYSKGWQVVSYFSQPPLQSYDFLK
jgi:hypothetical protein